MLLKISMTQLELNQRFIDIIRGNMSNQINFFTSGSDADIFLDFFKKNMYLRMAVKSSGNIISDIVDFNENIFIKYPRWISGYIFAAHDKICFEKFEIGKIIKAEDLFSMEIIWINIYEPIADNFSVGRIYKQNYFVKNCQKLSKSNDFLKWSDDFFQFVRAKFSKFDNKFYAGPNAMLRLYSDVDVAKFRLG